ncbi:MAG: DUF3072 domain-containing protein [Polyangiaceae bacterium]
MNQDNPKQLRFGVAKATRPKNPDQWVTGDEPMTRAQASYLKLLCEQAGEAFSAKLTKAQASKRIDSLRTNNNHLLQRRAS